MSCVFDHVLLAAVVLVRRANRDHSPLYDLREAAAIIYEDDPQAAAVIAAAEEVEFDAHAVRAGDVRKLAHEAARCVKSITQADDK